MKVLLALLGAFFITSVHAADWPVVTDRDGTHTKMFTRSAGGTVTLDTGVTQDVVTWGFSSSAVRICVLSELGPDELVYMRVGTSVSATSSANFISGGGNQGADSASALVNGSTAALADCEIYPLNVRGLIFHANTTGSTVSVQAFD